MKYTCLNPIASVGLDQFTEGYEKTEKMEDADAVLVRSAAMHDLELPDGLYAVARAGAGVNNIPLDKCAEKGIVVFNTPGANANGVKELVIAGMLLASRDIIGGVEWAKSEAGSEDIAKKAEKEICRMRTDGQKAWYHRTWCDRYPGGKRGRMFGYGCIWL